MLLLAEKKGPGHPRSPFGKSAVLCHAVAVHEAVSPFLGTLEHSAAPLSNGCNKSEAENETMMRTQVQYVGNATQKKYKDFGGHRYFQQEVTFRFRSH